MLQYLLYIVCVLCVYRGKVSEGIDFTDNKGRAVIITGNLSLHLGRLYIYIFTY